MFIIWKITSKALKRGMKSVGGSPVNSDFRPPWMTGVGQKKERWGRIDIFLAENLFIIKNLHLCRYCFKWRMPPKLAPPDKNVAKRGKNK